MHLPALVTVLSVVLWGQLLGLPGLLLAVPLDLLVLSICRYLLRLRGARAATA